jgi:mannose-6-phosphate isomerase-like protein (cupin superfamily)
LSKIIKINKAETAEWEGVCTMRWIASSGVDAKHLRFVHYTYDPDWSTKRTHLHHERESAYYILEGKALVSINGEETWIGEGEAVYVSPGDIHGIVASGPEGMKMLEVWAPVAPDLVYYEDGKPITE